MSGQYVAFVALMSVVVSLVSAQDIFFPGETDRPSRFPINPTSPLPTPPTNNNNNPTTQPPFVTSVTPPSVEAYNQCVTQCKATSEYNPVCGTDGVVYSNPGRMSCAFNCGNPVQFVKYGQCTTNIRG